MQDYVNEVGICYLGSLWYLCCLELSKTTPDSLCISALGPLFHTSHPWQVRLILYQDWEGVDVLLLVHALEDFDPNAVLDQWLTLENIRTGFGYLDGWLGYHLLTDNGLDDWVNLARQLKLLLPQVLVDLMLEHFLKQHHLLVTAYHDWAKDALRLLYHYTLQAILLFEVSL